MSLNRGPAKSLHLNQELLAIRLPSINIHVFSNNYDMNRYLISTWILKIATNVPAIETISIKKNVAS